MVNNAQPAASPLSEERVREIETRVATENDPDELGAMIYELLADRTALTARLEAVTAQVAQMEQDLIAMAGAELEAQEDAWMNRAASDGPPCSECGGWHTPRICPDCREIECLNCRCEREDDDALDPR